MYRLYALVPHLVENFVYLYGIWYMTLFDSLSVIKANHESTHTNTYYNAHVWLIRPYLMWYGFFFFIFRRHIWCDTTTTKTFLIAWFLFVMLRQRLNTTQRETGSLRHHTRSYFIFSQCAGERERVKGVRFWLPVCCVESSTLGNQQWWEIIIFYGKVIGTINLYNYVVVFSWIIVQ